MGRDIWQVEELRDYMDPPLDDHLTLPDPINFKTFLTFVKNPWFRRNARVER